MHGWKSIVAVCGAALLGIASAQAEKLDAPQWHFSANFPCQSQIGGQTAKTAAGDIIITSYSCGDDVTAYVIAINDIPAQLIKPETIDGMFAGAINEAAAGAKGSIRTINPYTLADFPGRDAIIDTPNDKTVMHLRAFLVGNRFYQVLYVGKAGTEDSKDCLEFLNSFTLIAASELVKPISPSAK